jgi:hypothetical protein
MADDLNRAPGLGPTREVSHRQVTLADEKYLPGSFIIDGAESRDPGASVVTELRPGLLVGRITANNKFAPSVIGAVTADYSDTGTELTTTAAAAAELVRRVGSSGTFNLVHAPTDGGTVVSEQVTYSAVDTATGVITVSDIGANVVDGALIQPEDGSEAIKTIMPNGYPSKTVDVNNDDRDIELPRYLTGGLVDASQIINWPSDATSIQDYITDALNAVGQFTFDSAHGL